LPQKTGNKLFMQQISKKETIMSNQYIKLKNQQEEEINKFPMVFAFNNKQFKEGMEKLGIDPKEAPDRVFKLYGGGYYLKENAPRLRALLTKHKKEIEEARKDKEFLFHMFNFELSNYEYCITGDINETLDALGITSKELQDNKKMQEALKLAEEIQSDTSIKNY